MKTNYMYIPTIEGAQPVTAKNFVSANRLIEAIQYIWALRYDGIGELFEDSIANAIKTTVYSTGDVEVNVSDFYGALDMNVLYDLEQMFGLERGALYDVELSAIKWWKVVIAIPTEDDAVMHASTTTMAVDDPIEECRRLLTDLEPKK